MVAENRNHDHAAGRDHQADGRARDGKRVSEAWCARVKHHFFKVHRARGVNGSLHGYVGWRFHLFCIVV